MATVLDRKTGYGSLNGEYAGFRADIASATDYYPFGMEMPGRTFSSGNSRFGFNGQEKDNEVKGNGNSINYQARIYDTRLSRFLSVDPLTAHFPWYTPYQFAGNTPIQAIDLDGAEEYHYTRIKKGGKTTSLKLTHTKDLYEWVWAPNWDKKTLWTKVKNKSQSYVVHQMQEVTISSHMSVSTYYEDESTAFDSYDKALKSTDADFTNTFEDIAIRGVQGLVNVRDEGRLGRVWKTSGYAMPRNFQAPKITIDRHGYKTNGKYRLDAEGMKKHTDGNYSTGKSQFKYGVDGDRVVLNGAAYADQNQLWIGNKAKVFINDGVVGYSQGKATQWINIYRTDNGMVHGAPTTTAGGTK